MRAIAPSPVSSPILLAHTPQYRSGNTSVLKKKKSEAKTFRIPNSSLLIAAALSQNGWIAVYSTGLQDIQGDFFNWPPPENVSRLAPPKNAWTGPPLNL